MLDSKLISRVLAPLLLLSATFFYANLNSVKETLLLQLSNSSFMIALVTLSIVAVYIVNHGGFFNLFKKSWKATKLGLTRNPYMRMVKEREMEERKQRLSEEERQRRLQRQREWFFCFPLSAGLIHLLLSISLLTLL